MISLEELDKIENVTVFDGLIKAQAVLRHHKKVSVSISGGSDSDIVLDIIEKARNEENEVTYVWFDTGVEYQATKDHLAYLEKRYGIKIERVRAIKTIPTCCREYGQPFLSKFVSEKIETLQRQGFQWEDEPYEVLLEKYPKAAGGIKWWCNWYTKNKHPNFTRPSQFDIGRNKWLKEFMLKNPPTFRVSSKCCTYAKKKVNKKYKQEHQIDLDVYGVRRSEGGIRAMAYTTCYSHDTTTTPTYRPVFWYTDEDKRYYEEHFGIVHSACYTQYGLRRTGCVGCPYSRDVIEEISRTELYEPKLIRACRNIFRDSYEYTRRYREFYAIMQDTEKHQINGQLTIYDMEGKR